MVQLRSLTPLLIGLYIPVFGLMFLVLLAQLWAGLPAEILTRDPLAVYDAPPYVGLISNLGILLWSATAGVCLFCAARVRRTKSNGLYHFFFISGLLSVLLCLDDLFLAHEDLWPRLLGTGEGPIIAFYGVLAGIYLWSFRDLILRTEYLLLGLSFAGLGFSILFDLLPDLDPALILPGQYLLEDGSKLLGIVTWLAYWIRTCNWGLGIDSEDSAATSRISPGP
jgi:hypothetical protein